MRQSLGILPRVHRAYAEGKESSQNSRHGRGSARCRFLEEAVVEERIPTRPERTCPERIPPPQCLQSPFLLPGSPRNRSRPARDVYSSRTVPFRKCGNRPLLTHQHDWRSSYKPPILGQRHGRWTIPHPAQHPLFLFLAGVTILSLSFSP